MCRSARGLRSSSSGGCTWAARTAGSCSGSQPDGQPGPGLSSDYAALESFFAELTELLRPLGNTDSCIYRDQNLCILLAGGQDAEPDWALWAGKINALAAHHALGR